MNPQTLDMITSLVTKAFDLVTLVMNRFIQLKSQMGTIKGYVRKKKDPEPEVSEDKEETHKTGGEI